ncbi:MAG: hypothetical protein ACPG77_08900, partial [Nannocystaceae bacterium]
GVTSAATTETTKSTESASSSAGSETTATETATETETTDDSGEPAPPPALHCPGDPSGICDPTPGAALQVGTATVSIVPACYELWQDNDGDSKFDDHKEPFFDCGCDRLCPGDSGYVEADAGEQDGIFQTIWMAGFGHARATLGPRTGEQGWFGADDGLWARTVVLRQGESTVAIVALDVIGWFNGDVEKIRAMLAAQQVDVDYLLVHSTHNHEGPDTMGLWGIKLLETGYNESYAQQVREAVVSSIKTSLAGLTDVDHMVVGEVDVGDFSERGVANVIRDSRDPVVIDETLGAVAFVSGGGETVATLVNFGNHPETLADDNLYLTSDYVHALRRTVEQGSQWPGGGGRAGVGGNCIFINAAVGGMMTTLGVAVQTPGGMAYKSASFEKADAIGQHLGEMALFALDDGEQVAGAQLNFQAQAFSIVVENTALQTMYDIGVIDREAEVDPDSGENRITTEMALINLGPLQLLSIPGEIVPELAIGGYDKSHVGSPSYSFIDPENPNPPDIASAPEGPYLKERMGGTYRWLVGLGNDEIGYILPEYNFELSADLPYVDEPEGDHYEETNSLGPATAAHLEAQADRLLDWSKQNEGM